MFELGTYRYPSKDGLKRKIKVFLETASEGEITRPDLVEKLHYLLLLHPRAKVKIGSGVDHFAVESNQLGSGKSFVVVRIDGSRERFSYKTCIDGQVVSNRMKVIEALRFSVRSQLIEFRRAVRLPASCTITGQTIVNHEDLHIDHKTPFWRIVRDFFREASLDLSDLTTSESGEHLRLVDSAIEEAFQFFHRRNAVLQVTHKAANLEKGGRVDS